MNRTAVLNPALNRAPEQIRHIHLMGVCGTGMAALAGMLKELGFRVTGSDRNVYPPMSDFLRKADIKVMEGYRPENLNSHPDLVIVGNVVRAVNPEALRLAEMGIPYLSMPQALAHFFLQGRTSLVVTGTHGKTTTSSLLATALHECGASPGFMIGGIVEAFQRNFALGRGSYFVVEGDEYDTAFFAKHSKFLYYRPDYAIITSIEYDHADIFADLQAIKDAFAGLIQLIPANGSVIACGDDPVVREIIHSASCPVATYGSGSENDWQVSNLLPQGLTTAFDLYRLGELFGRFQLPLPGRHNTLNAAAVIILLHQLGFAPETIRRGLAGFMGIKRRQQIRGIVRNITIIDDFAHHPTAVRETVAALKAAWPEQRLIVVFEPRTNTSRRSVFQQQYVEAFGQADCTLVREHLPLDDVPAEQQFSSARLVADLLKRGGDARYFSSTDAIIDYLIDFTESGDIVAILSNGPFDNIHERLLARLRGEEIIPHCRHLDP